MMKNRFGGVAVLLTVVALLAGCSSSSTSGGGTGGGTAAADLMPTAVAKVAEYEKIPSTYPGPTTPFTPGSGNVAVMQCGSQAPVCAQQGDYVVEAVQAMGWSTQPAFDGAFSPQVEAGFVDRAVQQKLDGIVLVSVDVNTISASIDRAIAAELPIVCVMCVSGSKYAGKGVTDVTVNFVTQGEIAAWAVLAQHGADSKVITTVDPAFSSSVDRGKGFSDVIKTNCPSCPFTLKDLPSVDTTKPGPPQFTAILSSNPKGSLTNYQATYDGLGIAAAKTTVQSGRTDLTVSGYDGGQEPLTAIVTSNPPYSFTVAEPYTYCSWAGVDLLGRIVKKAPLWSDNDNMPSTLIDKTNAQQFLDGNPAGSAYPAPAGDWQANFRKLWSTT